MNLDKIYKFLETGGKVYGDKNESILSIRLIEEELKELTSANLVQDNQEIKDAVVDLFFVIMNAAYYNGISTEEIEEMYERVYISNMSKFCTSTVEATSTVDAYKNGTHWDKLGVKIDCYYEKHGDYFIIKRHDGKILKSLNYKPVNKL